VLLDRSTDGGQTWLDLEIRLDTDEAGTASSVASALAVAGAVSRVVWYDTRDGPGDVYFNRAGP
jgi:hypothetical protein